MRLLLALVLFAATPLLQAAPVVWYLHGRFVEDHPPDALHPQHGRYEYDDILAQLRREGADVRSERRARDTDIAAYAERIAAEMRAERARGTPASQLAVVGASKGALIAAEVAVRLGEADASFVLMGACPDPRQRTAMRGRILVVHDDSDDFTRDCAPWPATRGGPEHAHLQLRTGRGHGFLYTARALIVPALDWIAHR